jgi:hypothetical protein
MGISGYDNNSEIDEQADKFINDVLAELEALQKAWDLKFNGQPFRCKRCGSDDFWQYKSNLEIRKCKQCYLQTRLRKGTLFEQSKVPMRDWMRAIEYYLEHKSRARVRGLMKYLGGISYPKAWALLMKIRAEKNILIEYFKKADG